MLTKDTYVQPHKHSDPPKPETFLILEGKLGFFIFDNDGNITEKYILSSAGPSFGIDIQPDVWHSIVCLTDSCICFEGKSGPYDPSSDKNFAKWAPSEGSPEAISYLKKLKNNLDFS